MVFLGMRHKEFRLIDSRKQFDENKDSSKQFSREAENELKQRKIIESGDIVN
jgi:hypothetical protein